MVSSIERTSQLVQSLLSSERLLFIRKVWFKSISKCFWSSSFLFQVILANPLTSSELLTILIIERVCTPTFSKMSADLITERPSHSSAFNSVKKTFSSFSVASILAAGNENNERSSSTSPSPHSTSAMTATPSPPTLRIHQSSPNHIHHSQHNRSSPVTNHVTESHHQQHSATLTIASLASLTNTPISPPPETDSHHIHAFHHFRRTPPLHPIPSLPATPHSPEHQKSQQLSPRRQSSQQHPTSQKQEIPQHSPEDLSITSARLSEDNRSDEDNEDEEEIHVDNESDEEMRSDSGIADPIPCYPPHVIGGIPGYHHPPHGVPPPPLPGSWGSLQFLHQQLAMRNLESKHHCNCLIIFIARTDLILIECIFSQLNY